MTHCPLEIIVGQECDNTNPGHTLVFTRSENPLGPESWMYQALSSLPAFQLCYVSKIELWSGTTNRLNWIPLIRLVWIVAEILLVHCVAIRLHMLGFFYHLKIQNIIQLMKWSEIFLIVSISIFFVHMVLFYITGFVCGLFFFLKELQIKLLIIIMMVTAASLILFPTRLMRYIKSSCTKKILTIHKCEGNTLLSHSSNIILFSNSKCRNTATEGESTEDTVGFSWESNLTGE